MRTVKRAVALAALLPCIVWGANPALAKAPQTAHKAAPGAATVQKSRASAQPDVLQPQASARAQVGIALTKIGPKTVDADSEIALAGLLKNRTEETLNGLSVRFRFSNRPVISRSELEQYSETPANRLPVPGARQPVKVPAEPGVKLEWRLETTAKAMGLRDGTLPGVYPVGVEVLDPAGAVIGGLTTFLTYMPDDPHFKPVQIGWVWPLVDSQHRTNDETFIDDELSADLAPDGRLTRLVEAASATDTPITWAIDPALLDDVRRMATGEYTVRAPGSDESAKKPRSQAAANWLKALKAASKSDPYTALPYADPDLLALVRNKMSRSIDSAFAPENTGVTTEVLGRAADSHLAWPPGGAVGSQTADQLARHALGSGGAFLLSSRHFQNPAPGTLANATTGFETGQGTKTALLYDETLSEIVSDSGDTRGSALLTEQRFLAETAMIAAEAPAQQRTVVVAPDRRWEPVAGLARNLLKYTAGADWLKDVPLSDIANAEPQARIWRDYPDHYERYELGTSYLERVRAIARRADAFHAVLKEPFNLSYERALLRVQSSAWRDDPKEAKAARVALSKQLTDHMGAIRFVTTKNKRINMAGSTGTLPVTIKNTLADQAVRVRLVATSANTAKLRLGQLDPEDQVIDLQPGEQVQSWIPAEAYGNGIFRMHLQLLIPGSGRAFGDGETVTVRATGYGPIALLITGGGLAVLFAGVGVRAIRARRRRKAEAAGDGSTGMGPGATGGPGDGFPGPGFAGPGLPDPELSGATSWDGAGAGPDAAEPGAGPSAEPSAEPSAGPTGAEPGTAEPGISRSGATRADPGPGGPAR